MSLDPDLFVTGARAIQAEGARIAICSCLICGAAIVGDPDDEHDARQRHLDWHRQNNDAIRDARR